VNFRSITFYGNCQAKALATVYQRHIAPLYGQNVHVVAVGEEDAAVQTLQDADVLVVQLFEVKTKALLMDLAPGVRRLLFPSFAAGFLWPFGSQAHPRNAPNKYFVDGPYPEQMGDSFLNRMIVRGVPENEAVQRYLDLDVNREFNLDRLFEMNIERQRKYDRETGFSVAPLIESLFQDEYLFFTRAHTNMTLVSAVARPLFLELGVPDSIVESALAVCAGGQPPFPLDQLPIHPAVIRHFGLRFVQEDSRYEMLQEGRFTFSEFAHRYFRYEWNEDLHEGVALVDGPDPARALVVLEKALRRSPGSALGFRCKARMLSQLSRHAEAEIAARQACALAPDDPDCLNELARVLCVAGQFQRAEDVANSTVVAFPLYAHSRVVLSEIATAQHRYDDAVRSAERAVELLAGDPDLRFHLGRSRLQQGDLDGAAQACLKAIELGTSVQAYRVLLAEVWLRQGRRQEAVSMLRELLEEPITNPHVCSRLGHSLAEAGDLTGAEQAFRKAMELAPTIQGFASLLAEVLSRQGRRDEALALLLELVAAGTTDAHTYARLGRTLAASGDLAGAEQAFRKAVELSPSAWGFAGQLAELLHQRGRGQDALVLLRQLIAEGSADPHNYAQLGHLLAQAGDLVGAEEALRKAVELAPSLAGFSSLLAEVLNQQGRHADALTILRHLISGGKTDARIYAQFGHTSILTGDFAGAEQALRKAIALAPSVNRYSVLLAEALDREGRHDEASALLRQVISDGITDPHLYAQLGQITARSGDLDSAEAAFRKALELAPANQSFSSLLAEVLNRQGRREEALVLLLRLVSEGTTDPQTYSRLGHVLAQSGDLGGAEQAFRKAVELAPAAQDFSDQLARVLKRQEQRDQAARARSFTVKRRHRVRPERPGAVG
jgi:Flp pilus assembly protein TadD